VDLEAVLRRVDRPPFVDRLVLGVGLVPVDRAALVDVLEEAVTLVPLSDLDLLRAALHLASLGDPARPDLDLLLVADLATRVGAPAPGGAVPVALRAGPPLPALARALPRARGEGELRLALAPEDQRADAAREDEEREAAEEQLREEPASAGRDGRGGGGHGG